MDAADPVRHIPPGERVPGHATPGMVREQAVATDGMWAGFVRTTPGATQLTRILSLANSRANARAICGKTPLAT